MPGLLLPSVAGRPAAVRLLLKLALPGCALLRCFSCDMHDQLLDNSTSQALSLPRFPCHTRMAHKLQ
jgi:hypothetical protein